MTTGRLQRIDDETSGWSEPAAGKSAMYQGMSVEEGRLTVLFDEVGYRTLAPAAVEAPGLLTGEPGRPG